METILYFIRHAESVFEEGKERTRGLSAQGRKDAQTISDILKGEDIDLFVSSPYEMAIETIRPAAIEHRKEVFIEEDLRERMIGEFAPATFKEAKYKVFENTWFSFPGGESSIVAQSRAASVISNLIDNHNGKKIVVGTHGDIMTLMMNAFDKQYRYAFWELTTMPDIYKLTIVDNKLVEVIRMWNQEGVSD